MLAPDDASRSTSLAEPLRQAHVPGRVGVHEARHDQRAVRIDLARVGRRGEARRTDRS